MEDEMNGADVSDVLEILADQRASDNRRVERYQGKLLFRLREQIVSRNPVSAKEEGPVAQFVAFAEWLGECKTLENTYLSESEGGQPRFRSLQMTADIVSDLRSDQLRKVIYRPDGNSYLEEWKGWVMPGLANQLNRWRHLPADALPLRITVFHEYMNIEPENRKLLEGHGNITLRFSVSKA